MPDNPEILEPDAGLGFTDRVSACVRRNFRGTMVQAPMTLFRRPLASCALVVLLLQVSRLIAAPVSACCRAAHAAVPAACCKAVQHQSGPCPMHAAPERPPRPVPVELRHARRRAAPARPVRVPADGSVDRRPDRRPSARRCLAHPRSSPARPFPTRPRPNRARRRALPTERPPARQRSSRRAFFSRPWLLQIAAPAVAAIALPRSRSAGFAGLTMARA